MSDTLYEATGTAWGGREGRAESSDKRVTLDLSVPKGLGGNDGPGTNPEQLFAVGYAACFHSALKLVAGQAKVDVSESAVTANVSLVGTMTTGLDLSVRIEAEMPGVEPSRARELLEQADSVCPYSRATHGNVAHTVTLVD